MRIKSAAHEANISKRGRVKSSLVPASFISQKKDSSSYPAGPVLIGFLIFVVVGSGIACPVTPPL